MEGIAEYTRIILEGKDTNANWRRKKKISNNWPMKLFLCLQMAIIGRNKVALFDHLRRSQKTTMMFVRLEDFPRARRRLCTVYVFRVLWKLLKNKRKRLFVRVYVMRCVNFLLIYGEMRPRLPRFKWFARNKGLVCSPENRQLKSSTRWTKSQIFQMFHGSYIKYGSAIYVETFRVR